MDKNALLAVFRDASNSGWSLRSDIQVLYSLQLTLDFFFLRLGFGVWSNWEWFECTLKFRVSVICAAARLAGSFCWSREAEDGIGDQRGGAARNRRWGSGALFAKYLEQSSSSFSHSVYRECEFIMFYIDVQSLQLLINKSKLTCCRIRVLQIFLHPSTFGVCVSVSAFGKKLLRFHVVLQKKTWWRAHQLEHSKTILRKLNIARW